jgi:hypothetical protein
MVVYSFSLGDGASIEPVIAGLVYIGTHRWPWIFKISVILTGMKLLSFHHHVAGDDETKSSD